MRVIEARPKGGYSDTTIFFCGARMKLLLTTAASLVLVAFHGCASIEAERPAVERILGTWTTNMQGQQMTFSYDGVNLTIMGTGMQMPYTITGNQFAIDVPGQGPTTQTLSFPSENEMHAATADGTTQIFLRVVD